tara:strand:- start:160 stop:552 length:393 start_codon:yes stop_codon:yes gene_type:complete
MSIDEKIDNFFTKLDSRLESVLDINARLMKENIQLRSQIGKDTPILCSNTTSNSFGGGNREEKKKVVIKTSSDSGDVHFTGNGTFDAKEIIKTMGEATFEKTTKAWILKPNVTLDFIKTTLEKDFEVQLI